jgi:hypothetical protein
MFIPGGNVLIFARQKALEPRMKKSLELRKQRFKRYVFEVGVIQGVDFNVPSYLPEKIKLELTKKLRQKEMLAASPPETVRRLIANVDIKVSVPPFARKGQYDEIESLVRVTDSAKTEIVARKTIHTVNAFGWTSDFTEITHARQTADFLEALVRPSTF